MEIKNKKAYFNYFIETEYEAGIVLKGTEIKSIRKGSANITDSYVRIKNNEAFIINMYIAKYEQGNQFNHDERRERKLLLNKKEILKLKSGVMQEGYNIIPLKLYIHKGIPQTISSVTPGLKMDIYNQIIDYLSN